MAEGVCSGGTHEPGRKQCSMTASPANRLTCTHPRANKSARSLAVDVNCQQQAVHAEVATMHTSSRSCTPRTCRRCKQVPLTSHNAMPFVCCTSYAHPGGCWLARQLQAHVAGEVIAVELQQVVLVALVMVAHLLYQVLYLGCCHVCLAHVYALPERCSRMAPCREAQHMRGQQLHC